MLRESKKKEKSEEKNKANKNKMETKPKTFEKYLEEICFEQNPEILDDEMGHFFDCWLGELDGEDYIKYGNKYAMYIYDRAIAIIKS